jgi:excisionase family DNA binding protein
MAEELLTVDEVARELRVNPQTVRNWIDRGELSARRIGSRRVRIRRDDLEDFIEQSASGPRTPSNRRRIEALEQQVANLAARLEVVEQSDQTV